MSVKTYIISVSSGMGHPYQCLVESSDLNKMADWKLLLGKKIIDVIPRDGYLVLTVDDP